MRPLRDVTPNQIAHMPAFQTALLRLCFTCGHLLGVGCGFACPLLQCAQAAGCYAELLAVEPLGDEVWQEPALDAAVTVADGVTGSWTFSTEGADSAHKNKISPRILRSCYHIGKCFSSISPFRIL